MANAQIFNDVLAVISAVAALCSATGVTAWALKASKANGVDFTNTQNLRLLTGAFNAAKAALYDVTVANKDIRDPSVLAGVISAVKEQLQDTHDSVIESLPISGADLTRIVTTQVKAAAIAPTGTPVSVLPIAAPAAPLNAPVPPAATPAAPGGTAATV